MSPLEEDSGLGALDQMVAEMAQAPAVIQPSKMWDSLNESHLAQLRERGFAEFKRTVNQDYFNWVPSRKDPQVQALLRAWARRPNPRIFTARFDGSSSAGAGPLPGKSDQRAYAIYTALVWEAVHRTDRLGLLQRLEEPSLGDPLAVRYRGRSITQDLCNSVHELSSAVEALDAGALDGGTVIELGGGYGRVAWAFLEQYPGVRYVVCDIPPALAVAERYLTTLFPDRPALRFRHFDDPAEVAEELEAASIVFLTPNQLDLLEPLGAELFLNISSLHEMRRDQIAHYLQAVDRHTAGFFYTKQWQRSLNAHDDLVVKRDEYPIPSSWREVYSRDHPIQSLFFEALYRVGA